MPAFGRGGALQPIAVEEVAVAKKRADFPAVDLLLPSDRDTCSILAVAVLHALNHRGLLLGERGSLKSKVLPATDADAWASFARIAFSSGPAGANCKAKSRYLKKPVLAISLSILGKFDRRRRGRRGLLEEGGERLHLVTGLHLDHVGHVRRVEKLRAVARHGELRAGPEHLLDAGRGLRPSSRVRPPGSRRLHCRWRGCRCSRS